MSYNDKPLMDFLAERQFTGLDGGIYSLGGCHDPTEKHYILLTDGLVIYSDYWDWKCSNKHIVWYPVHDDWPACSDIKETSIEDIVKELNEILHNSIS